MYEQLKELPNFSDYSVARAEGRIPSIASIRNRHLVLQRLTLLDEAPYGSTGSVVPVRSALRHRWMHDANPINHRLSDSIKNRHDDANDKVHVRHLRKYPVMNLDLYEESNQADRDVRRILDENLGLPNFHQSRQLLYMDFVGNHFYRDPIKRDLTLNQPRRSFAGSLVERTLYW